MKTTTEKIQIALTNVETGETTITGAELGDTGFDLKMETIFKVDDIQVHEFKNNSQVIVSGRGLDTSQRSFPCEISYLFFPDDIFEKQQTLKMYQKDAIYKIKGNYYFAYGITFFDYPAITPVVSKLKKVSEKIFQADTAARPKETKES